MMSTYLKLLGTILVGLLFMAGGILGIVAEYQVPPVHTTHLFGFISVTILGALILPGIGGAVLIAAKAGAGVAGQLAPVFGRRSSQGEIDLSSTPSIIPSTVPPPAPPAAAVGKGNPLDEDKP
jgi:hypothetical protein